jgi:hypothetical protein
MSGYRPLPAKGLESISDMPVPPKVIIFGIANCLSDPSSDSLFSDVLPTLEIVRKSIEPIPIIAIATNEGGPACRDAGWSQSDRFPTVGKVMARAMKFKLLIGAKLALVSLAYQTKNGNWLYPKGLAENDERLLRGWRKPAPGMLLTIAKEFSASPEQFLVVGGNWQYEDSTAAFRAGMTFMHADKFFKRANSNE